MAELTGEDRAALISLCQSYAEAADEARFDDMGSLFAEDGYLVSPRGTTEGRAKITKAFGGLSRYDHTFHQLGQMRLWAPTEPTTSAAAAVEAQGLVYCTAHHFTGDNDHVMFIRYHDTYSRGDGTWKFQERRLEVPVQRDY